MSSTTLERFFRLLLVLVALLAALAGAMFGSQWHTATPPTLGADGRPLPGSIASLEQVTLNGSQQWITIRGTNIHHPVLLDLGPGGPGAGGIPNREYLAPLEEHFVVVSWNQPGTGKSYGAVPMAQLTPQGFVADAYALTQQLRARFHQDKIYLLGQSWSSILGIWLVQKYPELYSAYIGQGQMVTPRCHRNGLPGRALLPGAASAAQGTALV
jgi:pimeloyl-ACP methyl ester carboxylesterase